MRQLSFADQNLIFYLRGGQVATPAEWQLQLKAGDYYCAERPIVRRVNPVTGQAERTEGPTVYGQLITNTPAEGEPPYRPGCFLVRAYSSWASDGELGTFHISEATRQLTADQFEAARAAGWPDELPTQAQSESEDCPDCGNSRVCQHCAGDGHDPDRTPEASCPLCLGSGICPFCRKERKGE